EGTGLLSRWEKRTRKPDVTARLLAAAWAARFTVIATQLPVSVEWSTTLTHVGPTPSFRNRPSSGLDSSFVSFAQYWRTAVGDAARFTAIVSVFVEKGPPVATSKLAARPPSGETG